MCVPVSIRCSSDIANHCTHSFSSLDTRNGPKLFNLVIVPWHRRPAARNLRRQPDRNCSIYLRSRNTCHHKKCMTQIAVLDPTRRDLSLFNATRCKRTPPSDSMPRRAIPRFSFVSNLT
ncbi:hypothetical protein VDGE_30636 [Verticillium dahliae]|uniref:Uncharacterized protein n=1 Tax=Verticillium dahliae TaxID=27337 RepID=A0A444S6S9_VERDA|nr:hypothetical protein VDGE_30636 [Verticillium dahliae]